MYTRDDVLYTLYLAQIASNLLFYTSIITCMIGLIGDSASVAVYLRREFRKRSNGTYFAALGIFEILFLLANIVYVIQPYLWSQNDAFCKVFRIAQAVVQYSCSWILVLNALDRVVLITMPNRLLFMRKIKFQLLAIASIVLILTAITVPNIIFMRIMDFGGKPICNIVNSTDYFYYNFACTIIYLILPFFIMLTCSIIIIFRLKKLRESLKKTEERRIRDYDLAKTILMSNIYFLIILLPYCVIGTLTSYFRTFDFNFSVVRSGQINLTYNVFFGLLSLFHATTFLLHISCNKLFRQIIIAFLRGKVQFVCNLKGCRH